MKLEEFVQNQNRRTLIFTLVVIIVLCIILGFMNLLVFADSIPAAVILFITAGTAVASLFLVNHNLYKQAIYIIITSVMLSALFNVFVGQGLNDPAVISLPIVILFGGLLLGKKSVPLFTIIILVFIIFQTIVQYTGIKTYRIIVSTEESITVGVLILAASLITYVIMSNYDIMIAKIRGQAIDLENELDARRIAEIALRDSENRYKTIFHGANDAIFIQDIQTGAILDVNDRMTEMYGYTRDEALSRTIETLSLGKSPYSWKEALNNIREASKGNPRVFEWQAKHKTGRLFWVEVNMRSIQILGKDKLLVLVRDIDARKKAEHNLLFAQKLEMLGMLSSGIVHDFNNILFSLKNSLEITKSNASLQHNTENQDFMSFIDITEQLVDRLSTMTRRLLALSRKEELVFSTHDLNQLVEQVTTICRKSFDSSITITCSLYPSIAAANIDVSQIEQALLNLCINAAHAVTSMRKSVEKQGGMISIRIDKVETEADLIEQNTECDKTIYWRIAVHDDGVGMNKQIIDTIFEPFYTTKGKGKGTGLGLAMVRNTIKNHSGFVTVESEENRGSTFSLFIPLPDE